MTFAARTDEPHANREQAEGAPTRLASLGQDRATAPQDRDGLRSSARASLRAARERSLELPFRHRSRGIQDLGQLREADLYFLVEFHESQTALAVDELSRRGAPPTLQP